jgi:hypothetical protein
MKERINKFGNVFLAFSRVSLHLTVVCFLFKTYYTCLTNTYPLLQKLITTATDIIVNTHTPSVLVL